MTSEDLLSSPSGDLRQSAPFYLAGDIGGTKTLLALFSLKGTRLTLIKEIKLASANWQDLSLVISSFLAEMKIKPEEIASGCLSLAGPIAQDACLLTNLNRRIDFKALRSSFNFPLSFANDLEAMGHGLLDLGAEDCLCLNPSIVSSKEPEVPSQNQNRALIAPGTGLGQAMILGNQVYPSEGAHADFAPQTEQEVKLWRFLAREYGHVSYERILSGPGLENIYRFLRWESNQDSRDSIHTLSTPTPQEITKKALAGICPFCTETLELFIKILGAEAGNLALRTLANGGIYLGGGIPPKILPRLQAGPFLEAFLNKGRFRDFLAHIPVYVILNERTALLGAARLASLKKVSIFKQSLP